MRPNGNRPTRIFDSQGHVLAQSEDQPNGSGILLANVRPQRVWTLYSRIGDVFAYLCAVGLIVLAGWAFVRCGQPAPLAQPMPA